MRIYAAVVLLVCFVVGCGKIDESEYASLDNKDLRDKCNELFAKRQYRDALSLCEYAIKSDKDVAWYWLSKVFVLEGLHRYDEALAAAESLYDLLPPDSDIVRVAYARKSYCLYRLKRYKESIGFAGSALAIKQKFSEWEVKARCYYELEDYGAALDAINRALEINPGSSFGRYWKRVIEHQL